MASGGEEQFRAGIGPLPAGADRVPAPAAYRCSFRCVDRTGAGDLSCAHCLEYDEFGLEIAVLDGSLVVVTRTLSADACLARD
jgi:hypothetical protein